MVRLLLYLGQRISVQFLDLFLLLAADETKDQRAYLPNYHKVMDQEVTKIERTSVHKTTAD